MELNTIQNRLIGNTDLPTNLPPVFGWQDAPLLSLYEAFQRLQQIPYINDNILYSLDSATNFLLENNE